MDINIKLLPTYKQIDVDLKLNIVYKLLNALQGLK